MPLVGAWCIVWIYFGFVFAWTKGARPRFDTSTDMGLVLVPADAEIDSVIFRLRATDQDADFPLVFEITATITPVVRIDNLPCTLYNKVCQANVILTKRLIPGRLHDFAVRVRDTKGDSNSMQATISVTNATTPRDKIFPHIPSLIMVPEDTKPGKELDYLLVRANSWSGKPVYIELWQPKELFTIRQRQTPTQTRGIITLIGELDFETQSMYTLTMYATDPYTEPGKDTRNIAGLNLVVIVQDVQDVPPIFTLAPPLTRINNSVQTGDIILRVHAEDGDKGVPREITYGLVSEGNPFTPFFNISETTGEIVLARPLEELTQITHVGAPVVLTVVAEEIRRSRDEPPAQATVVDVGFLLGEPGNSPPYFESDNYVATIDENPEPGAVIYFGEQYTTRVRDEDIGKAGVFALKLENNNGTFEINPTVAERTADFVITVRDNALIDYELHKSLSFKIIAQEVGPATNLSASVRVTILLRDVNDNPPVFSEESYEVTLSENVTAGTRVVQVHATDKDTGLLGSIRYTGISGEGSNAFSIDPDAGLITVSMGSSLDREIAPRLLLSVEAQDENGNGNKGVVPLIVNLLDVNDNAPLFGNDVYEFTLNSALSNFTSPAVINAIDADAEPPNNAVRYELIHGNYENKFYLNDVTGELFLRSPITRIRRKKQSAYETFARKTGKEAGNRPDGSRKPIVEVASNASTVELIERDLSKHNSTGMDRETTKQRRKRANGEALYTLTARAYDLGVPHLSSVTQIRVLSGAAMEARIMMFVVPGEHPDSTKTAETLATITGGRVTVLETRPYVARNQTGGSQNVPGSGKKSIVVARVEQTEPGTPLVDVEKIRETLAANGVGIIGDPGTVTDPVTSVTEAKPSASTPPRSNGGQTTNVNNTISTVFNEEVTVYKAENKLLFWLLIILGTLMLLAIAGLIICCICPGCPFYMAPRKRRVHSSETLIVRSDGRPKRHLHRKPAALIDTLWNGRKQAWSADPTRRNWQFNRRNTKNCGQSSLPGDVAYISGQSNDVQVNIEPLRQTDRPVYDFSRRSRLEDQERMYMEDVDGQKMRNYDMPDMDSLQRHEIEGDLDVHRQSYRQRYPMGDPAVEAAMREQHFYREGNAEVLRLVTRGGQLNETIQHHHHPTTLVIDGKDIILERFMEDQKSRHELAMQDIEAARSMESHQRSKDLCQQPELLLVPDRLDLGHHQHVDELGPNVQRLVIDHGNYESPTTEKASQIREGPRHEGVAAASTMTDRPTVVKEQSNNTQYSFHDLELARQNALLTRLLLERENRHISGVMDSASYLETQSLPGQVAIATQTDRTAATQTDRHVRSRSDNDESDEDSRYRKKLKSKKKYGDADWKRTRTLWMKSPIEEEGGPCFDKRLSILRKKVREVKEGRKIALEPDVLREISDSLDGNGSSGRGDEEESTRNYQRSTEQTSIRYKVLNEDENDSPSSLETRRDKYERVFTEKSHDRVVQSKIDTTESTSSPEVKGQREERGRGRAESKSPKKEPKAKAQRKSEGVIKPSFRILEREITMLTKKLSKLGDKKPHESTGSDSTSQEKSEGGSKDVKKEQKGSKKVDAARQKQAPSTAKTAGPETTVPRKEVTGKTKQKLKQQAQMSTASSEYDDAAEKPRKQGTVHVQETVKQKPIGPHAKLKRQPPVDRRELKKQIAQDHDGEKRKDVPKDTRLEGKPEKVGKAVRAPKLAVIARREHVSEKQSTDNSSDRTEIKKSVPRDSDKKSNGDTSGNGSHDSSRRERRLIPEEMTRRIVDYFAEGSKKRVPARLEANGGEKEAKMSEENSSGSGGKRKAIKGRLEGAKDEGEQVEGRGTMETAVVRAETVLQDVSKEFDGVYQVVSDIGKKDNVIETFNRDDKYDKTAAVQFEPASVEESREDEEKTKSADLGKDDEQESTEKLRIEFEKDESLDEIEKEAKLEAELESYVKEDESLKDVENEISTSVQDESNKLDEVKLTGTAENHLQRETKDASQGEAESLPLIGVEDESKFEAFAKSQEEAEPIESSSDIKPTTAQPEQTTDSKSEDLQEAKSEEKAPNENGNKKETMQEAKSETEKEPSDKSDIKADVMQTGPLKKDVGIESLKSSEETANEYKMKEELSQAATEKKQGTKSPVSPQLSQNQKIENNLPEESVTKTLQDELKTTQAPLTSYFQQETMAPGTIKISENILSGTPRDAEEKIVEERKSVSPIQREDKKETFDPERGPGSPTDTQLSKEEAEAAVEEKLETDKQSAAVMDDKSTMPIKQVTEIDQNIDANGRAASSAGKKFEHGEKYDEFTTDKTVTPTEPEESEEKRTPEVQSAEKVTLTMEPVSAISDDIRDKETSDEALEKTVQLDELLDDKTSTFETVEVSSSESREKSPARTSDNFEETKLLKTTETFEVAMEEISRLSLITSQIDPDKVAEPTQLKPQSKQIELGEDQSGREESLAASADKSQNEEQLREEQAPTFQDESWKGREDERKETLRETPAREEEEAEPTGYADVSLPLFTSIIDTLDDSDESDSSSDISRKTMLATRPYQTPRHHVRRTPEESVDTLERTETMNVDTDEELAFELTENGDTLMSTEIHETKDSEELPAITLIETTKQEDSDESSAKVEPPMYVEIPVSHANEPGNLEVENTGKSAASKSDWEVDELFGRADRSKPVNEGARSNGGPTFEEAKPGFSKTGEKKAKPEGKLSPRRKKKQSPEEKPEEKSGRVQEHVHHGRYRFYKPVVGEQVKKEGQAKQRKPEDERRRQSIPRAKEKEKKGGEKSSSPPKTGEIDTSKAQPKYMAWYKKKREEMERKRAELKAADDEDQLPRWLRRSMRNERLDKERKSQKTTVLTPRTKRKVKPLVNVESEQLKAIVRQGRKLRRAEGGANEDPPIQIFATSPPAAPPPDIKHHLVQHSEYKYEKIPAPFYLHPPPAPHPSPQMSPERFDARPPCGYEPTEEVLDSGIGVSLQSGARLRHQQLLEKKSVFDIAYNEAAPSQLRSDSTTPPS